MGAWGEGPFDNDDASDWAYEFEGLDAAAGLELVTAALDLGAADEYVEAPEGINAVAAAAVVSWVLDPSAIPESPYGEEAAKWVRNAQPTASDDLRAAALVALARVRSEQSELAELWAEGDSAAWIASVEGLEARLRA
jgi:hypothetical protein